MWGKPEGEIAPLTAAQLAQLRALVQDLSTHQGPWSEWQQPESETPGTYIVGWPEEAPVVSRSMRFLYDAGRVISFDWPGWDEGRRIFSEWNSGTAAGLDHLTVLKLLTAVARNDRFNEGAWAGMFESGPGIELFARLLHHEEVLAGGESSRAGDPLAR